MKALHFCIIVAILILNLCSSFVFSSEVNRIRYIAPLESNDSQKDYFINVLKAVCAASSKKYGPCELIPVKLPMYQQRQLVSLQTNLLDVVWTVSNNERENLYRAIKFPLMSGLMGYRIAVYNTSVNDIFNNNQSIDKIKQLKLVQGIDWPDVDILMKDGFNVLKTRLYKKIYSDTSRGIFDFTLRGALEVIPEFEKYGTTKLKIDQKHLFVYPSNIYFFVRKDNEALAKRIDFGLKALNKDDGFFKLLLSYPSFKNAIPQLNLSKRKIDIIGKPTDNFNVKMIKDVISKTENLISQ